MIGLHAPDGLLNAPVAVALLVVSGAIVAFALRSAGRQTSERIIPLAGLMAAFLFVAQMLNFPIGAGTSAHLVGGALAAILLGPELAVVALAIVVLVQALLFSDGGLTALGINLLNLAIVPTYGGYGAYRVVRRVLPNTAGGVVAGAGLAGAISIELSAVTFSIEWLFGATAPVSFTTVFNAMVGVHLIIAIAEGVITALVVSAVLASRPDLLGAHGALPASLTHRSIGWRPFAVGVVVVIAVLAGILAPMASSSPDGLEQAVTDTGIGPTEQGGQTDGGLANGVFSDYAIEGVKNERLAITIAAVGGALVCGLMGVGAMRLRRAAG